MTNALDDARTIAIAALNEAHAAHGMKQIMGCKFCTSLSAEMTIARHIEPLLLRLHTLERDGKAAVVNLQSLLDRMTQRAEAAEADWQAAECRLGGSLERIERLREWIENRVDDCPYGEPDADACGRNRKHGICESHSASRVLAQDTFVSDASAVETHQQRAGEPVTVPEEIKDARIVERQK